MRVKKNLFQCDKDIIIIPIDYRLQDNLALFIKKKFDNSYKALYKECKTNTIDKLYGSVFICEDYDYYIAFIITDNIINESIVPSKILYKALEEIKDFADMNGFNVAIPYFINSQNEEQWKKIRRKLTSIFKEIDADIYKL